MAVAGVSWQWLVHHGSGWCLMAVAGVSSQWLVSHGSGWCLMAVAGVSWQWLVSHDWLVSNDSVCLVAGGVGVGGGGTLLTGDGWGRG